MATALNKIGVGTIVLLDISEITKALGLLACPQNMSIGKQHKRQLTKYGGPPHSQHTIVYDLFKRKTWPFQSTFGFIIPEMFKSTFKAFDSIWGLRASSCDTQKFTCATYSKSSQVESFTDYSQRSSLCLSLERESESESVGDVFFSLRIAFELTRQGDARNEVIWFRIIEAIQRGCE